KVLLDIIRYYTREAGVRSLEREIAKICRKAVRELLTNKGKAKSVTVTSKSLEKFLGVQRFRFGKAEEENRIGQVTGLAWTEVGGELLTIEAATVQGKGKLQHTGQLGEVMQESIQAAMTVVRSRAQNLGLEADFYQKLDIHLHVPEGATPKDGPSAGIGMCTALVSALTKIPVRSEVAMTGEITLRGEVLPIGGLKEKLLAAARGGITTVVIPVDNKKDLTEIPDNIKGNLDITARVCRRRIDRYPRHPCLCQRRRILRTSGLLEAQYLMNNPALPSAKLVMRSDHMSLRRAVIVWTRRWLRRCAALIFATCLEVYWLAPSANRDDCVIL
ncbi:MAG: hypothetical protein EBV29_12390, partial [Gammaproteobacteria bacterium]|nr:hypothetical protein [Gammaproteobacteria bacterium]